MNSSNDISGGLNAGWWGTSQSRSTKAKQPVHILVRVAHPKVGLGARREGAALC